MDRHNLPNITLTHNVSEAENNHNLKHAFKYKSGFPEVLLRKGVLKTCSKFTGEHPSSMSSLPKVV